MAARFTLVGIGEALFDVFPQAQVLGGAPLNAAVHAHQVAAPLGGRGVAVSRIGQDALGQQLLEELGKRGLTTEFIQSDPDFGTGQVYVGVDEGGEPTYDIVRDVAWDMLQFDPDTENLARSCEAVCYGTLAQRDGRARNSIYRFLEAARRAVRLFDVNLRQRFYDQRILRRSCELATVVKLNEHELPVVVRELGIIVEGDGANPDLYAQALLKKFNLQMLALTRGERGTTLYTPTGRHEGEAVSYPPADHHDHVGAGDACAAGLLVGLVQRKPIAKTLALANHMGAFVASQPGATPLLPQAILDMARG